MRLSKLAQRRLAESGSITLIKGMCRTNCIMLIVPHSIVIVVDINKFTTKDEVRTPLNAGALSSIS